MLLPSGIKAVVATWLTLDLLEIPRRPQKTADFCSVPPPTEFPDTADYAQLAFPLIAKLDASYWRFGNQIRAGKWSELCEYAPPPGAQPGFYDGPAHPQVCGQDQVWPEITYVFSVPPRTARVALRAIEYSVGGIVQPWPDQRFLIGPRASPPAVGSEVTGFYVSWRNPPNPQIVAAHEPESFTQTTYIALAKDSQWGAWGPAECIRFSVQFQPYQLEPQQYEAPPLTEPANFPAAPGCPTVDSLQDLADYICSLQQRIEALSSKLDWLSGVAVPPTYVPDELQQPVSDPTVPVEKPRTAVGVAITFSAPTFVSRYGSSPGAFYDVGFVTLGTDDGWLPSLRLKHNPQVILPIASQITRIALDLQPGVTASYRWLHGPK